VGVAAAASLMAGLASASADDVTTALAAPSVRSSIAGESFYFAMTDRYRNGDTSNDRGGVTGPASVTGYEPASDAYFHGGDFAGLTGKCDPADPTDEGMGRIKRLGYTALWVTPPVVNRTVQGSSAAYHGYWFLDLTRPDPHLGTEAQFADLMTCAHRLGIKVFLDVVVNHTADVISFRGGDYSYVPIEQRPYRTAAGRAFNPWSFTKGTTFPALRASRSFAKVPVVQPAFANAKGPALLNDVTRYHNRGDIDWSTCVGRCEMDGDFFGLDDLMTEDWSVVQSLAQAYGDWVTKYGVDGFRIDTAKHVDPYFFGRWLPLVQATANAAGRPGFTTFGEIWITDPAQLSEQMLTRQLPSVLDFPYQDTVRKYVSNLATGGSLKALFADDDYYTSASTNAYGLTTFLGNHDMGRIGFFIRTDNASESRFQLERDLLAHDILYLTRGVPVAYYGDEVGMTGSGDGKDKNARQDMFPTQVGGWQTEPRIGSAPIGAGSSFASTDPLQAQVVRLNALRREFPALATGAQITRVGEGGAFVASRIDAKERREFLVAFNTGTSAQSVSVPTSTPGAQWTALLGSGTAISDAQGRAALTIPARSALVLRAASVLPAPGAPSISVKVGRDDASGTYRAEATVPGTDPASVTFVLRSKGTAAWSRIGTDDARDFRVYLDPARLGRGRAVEVAAIVTDSMGQQAMSTSVPVVLKPLF
jgi:glycosidase